MDEELLDKKRIDRLLGNDDPSFFEEMTELFEERSLTLINELELYSGEGRAREVAKAMHALKGISLTVGAGALASLCLHCEEQLKKQELLPAAEQLTRIAALRQQSIEAMRKLIPGTTG